MIIQFMINFNLFCLLVTDFFCLTLNFQVFPIKHLMIFTEEELERLLCGEREFWAVCIFNT
jgi:hypothetical protein